MEPLLQDLRYGMRRLLRNPGFTIVAVLSLALGIGANTAIFSVINTVLLTPLPYANPEQLMIVWETNRQNSSSRSPASLLNFIDWREQNQSFEQMAALRSSGLNLTEGAQPERIQAMSASPNFFTVLGAKPALGRTFLPHEEKAGSDHVVVLSNRLWQGRFGSDRNILGKDIKLNGEPYNVIGVMPADFQFEDVSLWTPLTTNIGQLSPTAARSRRVFLVLARLKSGSSMAQAQAEMNTISGRLAQQYPEANDGWTTSVIPFREQVVGAIRPALFLLFAVVGFILLIACANMANLLLARAASRQKEVSIRAAVGASRVRLVRQFLTESILLAMFGGILGLALAFAARTVLMATLPANNPFRDQLGIDGKVLAFTLLVSILTGVIFGLLPALQASKPNLNKTLKEGGKSSLGSGHHRIRSVLVVTEVTLALMLLIGAGLVIRSFLRLQYVDTGFNVKNALAMQLSLPQTKYREPQVQVAFFQNLLQKVAALPNVEAVSADSNPPLGTRRNSISFFIEGQPPTTPDQMLRAEGHEITPNYFRAMGIPFLAGRDFTDNDSIDAPPVVIVNQALVKRFFPNENPIGKRISRSLPGQQNQLWFSIVGVAGDVRHAGLAAENGPQIYSSYYEDPVLTMSLVIRSRGNPTAVALSVRSEIQKADSEIPVFNIKSMEQMASESIAPNRIMMLLLGFFAIIALILAAAGIYGIMAYSVTQRTFEVGIRMALGAQRRDIITMIVKQGMVLTLIGLGIGFLGALAATRVLSSVLFEVSATDLVTFATALLVLTVVALVSCLIPARRATKVDPVIALRYE